MKVTTSTVSLQLLFRWRREEEQCRRAEEQARQEAEARRLVEEKRRREEEEQRRAEEERAQAMREAALLQKQVPSKHIVVLTQEKTSLFSRHCSRLFIRVRMLFAERGGTG